MACFCCRATGNLVVIRWEIYRKAFEVVCAIEHIHWTARQLAGTMGCEHKGYLDSIYVLTYGELLNGWLDILVCQT